MRIAGVALAALVACSGNKTEKLCDKIAATVCDHQAECDIVSDVFVCETEFEDQFSCDPEATDAELQTCIDAAKAADCQTAIPFLCFDVLCDEAVGCQNTPADTDTDTLTDTDTDTTP